MSFRKDIHALYPEKDETETGKEEARRRFAEDALPHRDKDIADAPDRPDTDARGPRTERVQTAPQGQRDFRAPRPPVQGRAQPLDAPRRGPTPRPGSTGGAPRPNNPGRKGR